VLFIVIIIIRKIKNVLEKIPKFKIILNKIKPAVNAELIVFKAEFGAFS
jgi:hypothetical protein